MPTDVDPDQPWAILEDAGYAILFDEDALRDFEDALRAASGIDHVFLVTDSPESYGEMRAHLGPTYGTSMLYRDYLRNVRIDPTRLA